MSREYIDKVGDPKKMSRTKLTTTIAAVERVSEPFYDWFYNADEGTDYEAYLQERIAAMGSYLIACYSELESRSNTGSDVMKETL